jgi:hypothetical protein
MKYGLACGKFYMIECFIFIGGVRRGVSKRKEDGRRLLALQVGHPRNGCKPVSGVACPQSVERSGMVGRGETLESPWQPLAIHL